MKTTGASLGILAVTLGLAVQVQAQSFLTNGLVLYYPFNGNANDASGNGNDGTVNGATLAADRFGITNSAYYFNGVSEEILVPETIFGPTNAAWTLSAWITTDSGPYAGDLQIYTKSSANGQAGIGILDGQIEIAIKTASQTFYIAAAPLLTNSTIHVVGVYQKGQSLSLYLNGLLVTNTPVSNENLWVSSFPLISSLGSYHYTGGPYEWFRGTIDDFRVYTRALSSNEVQQLYAYESGTTAGCVSPPAGLVGWWAGEGNANDSAGTNNGVLLGGTGFAAGEVWQAFNFNGLSNCVTNAMPGLTNILGSFTMEFWAWPTAGRTSTSESTSGLAGISNQRYAIFPHHGVAGFGGAGVSVGTNGVSVFEHSDTYLPSLLVYNTAIAVWTHIAVVYQNKQPSLYLNGALVRTGLVSTQTAHPSTCLGEIGIGYGYYAGLLDEVSIYNRALAAAEIQAIYNAGSAGKCAIPVPPVTTVPTNLTVCAGSPAIFSVAATGGGLSYQWQVSGDGGITFTNISNTSTNASYTNMVPTLAHSGNQYKVVVTGGGVSVTSAPPSLLTVNAPATATAGGNQTVSGTNCVALNSSVGGCATGGVWTTSGSGTFLPNATTLNATYCPATADLARGTVTLTLTSTGPCAPCTNATAQLVVTLQAPPAIGNAPTNLTLCAGSPAVFSVGATGGGLTYQWQVSRDGGMTFTNISGIATNASYTNSAPTVTENGDQYQAVVSASGGSVTSSPPAVLTVNAPATVSTGGNQTICAGNSTLGLGGSVGGGATGGTWSSSGTGSFLPNATKLNAAYTPSAADITAGTVTLALTATGQLPPCVATAQVVVTIQRPPVITNPPSNLTIVAGWSAVLSVGATGAGLTYQWQVSHDGGTTFTNISNTATNASYTYAAPTLADNGNRYQVIVSGACPPPVTSSPPAVLTVNPPAQASLGTSARLEGPGAGSDSVVLAMGSPTSTWIATANAAWLHLSVANQSGTGSTNVVFSYDVNPGATRTGTLTVAGQTLTVTQAGSTYVAAPGPVTTLVGSGLNMPAGVAVDGAGSVYFSDSGNGAIKKWVAASNTVTLVTGGLNWPQEVAVDGTGNVYIADLYNNAVKKWTAASNTVTTLVGSGLSLPNGVALDAAGNVYIGDTGNNVVREWTVANNTVTTLVPAGLDHPLGVAVDGAGNVYIADNWHSAIKKWMAANNTVTTLVGSGLVGPCGVAVDGAGNVYIVDRESEAVLKWTAASNAVTTLVTGLYHPQGVAVDGAGNVYIADSQNDAIKELPRALVDPTAKVEGPATGSDVLPIVLPATVNLLAPFAPASDSAWLTITGITNGAVSYAFSANTTGTNRMAHITILGEPIAITQAGGVTQPAQLTACAGSPAVFSVGTTGVGLAYQWQVSWDGGTTFTNISNTATNASYTNAAATLADNGNQYRVIVSWKGGSLTSAPPSLLTVNAPATVSVGGNRTICAGNSTLGLGGSVGGGATGGRWSSSGTGSFVPNATTLNAAYTPSAADITAGIVTLTLSSTGQLAPCPTATGQMVVRIQALPAVASAPTSLTVFAGSPAVFSVGATGQGLTYQWQVSRNGGVTFTNISNAATNASYTNATTTLADNGNQYRVIVSGACPPPATSAPPAVLTVIALATASTGGNQTICAGNNTLGLGGSVGGAATGGVWSSSGPGGFVPNATTLNAAYTPSAADITAGTVTLTLTSTGQPAPCAPATAQTVVRIQTPPVVANAPTSLTICAGSPAVFSVSAPCGSPTYQWQVSRNGGATFTNISATATNASYTNMAPGLADNGNQYQVAVSTTGASVTSAPPAVLTVNAPATANAGPDQTTWAGWATAGLGGTVGGGATGGTWTSSGTGSFAPNATTLNAVYTPSAGDAAAGTVTLTLTSTGQTPCSAATAQVRVTVTPSTSGVNVITVPSAQTVCAPNPATFTVNATATVGNLLIQWEYSPDGGNTWNPTPDGGENLSTTFSPTTAGENGWLIMVFLADYEEFDIYQSPPVTLTVYPAATASAGADQTICRNASTTGLGGTVGGGATGGTWTSSGSGTFAPNATTLNASYTPSAGDASAGTVTLTLTSSGQNALCATATAQVRVTIKTSTVNAGPVPPVCYAGSIPGGLSVRAWTGGANTSGGTIDGAQFDLLSPNPAPNASTAAGTIGYATQSINMNNSGTEHFTATDDCGVAAPGPFPTGYINSYSVEYRGKLYIATAGNYSFATTSDDGSALWLDPPTVNPTYAQAIVQNNYSQGMTTRNSSAIALAAGYHDIIIRYNQGGGGNGLQVQWDPTGGSNWQPIPGNLFYSSTTFPVTLAGSFGGAATNAVWSGGAGSFSPNNTTMNATYSATLAEVAAGSVTLTLTAQPCGDATSQVVLGYGQPPAAPITVSDATCGPGVVYLSASGGGGTFKWYSNPGLTTLINTGSTYTPTISTTTTYYVTETSAIGCTGPSSPVTGYVASGVASVNAGPSQSVSATYGTVQLAGSMTNTPCATWSGGAGTFSPNNRTLNAVYTPTAAERAAGSWVLTLTADPSPCGGGASSSTMILNFMQLAKLPIVTNSSTLQVSLMLRPVSGGTDIGTQTRSDTKNVLGYMGIELDNPSLPTKITLQDYRIQAMGSYVLTYAFTFSGIAIPVAVTIGSLADTFVVSCTTPGSGTPATIYPDGTGTGGTFTNLNVPFSTSGASYYSGTAVGSLDMTFTLANTNSMRGNIHVTNEVATAHFEFTVTTNMVMNIDTATVITAQPTFLGIINAVGPTIFPRDLVWNNGAGTFNWNTTDYNWNLGTAKWDNHRPDNAIFGTTGSGTINLTVPITAGSLWFQAPGYAIAGSSVNALTLANASAVTNDADAFISAPIAGGSVNKWGAGMLTLSGANTYSGGTFVNAGVLRINADTALGAEPISRATNLTLNGGQLFSSSSSSLAANRTVSLGASGGFIEAGGGATFTIAGNITGLGGLGVVWDGGTVGLNGANTYAGATTIGTTGITYNNSSGASPTLQLGQSGALPGTDLIFGTSANANTARLDLHGTTNTVAALTGGANAIVDSLSGGAGKLIVGNNNASSTFSGIIQNTAGTLALTKIGSGTLTLANANTYIGNTYVNGGTLVLPSGGSLLSQVRIGAGAMFDVSAQASPYLSPPLGGLADNTGAATLIGPAGGTIAAFQPMYLYIDAVRPALTVAAGTSLSLNGNTFIIDADAPLPAGIFPLIGVTSGSLVTNGTFAVTGPAIATGYGGVIEVSGNRVMVEVLRLSPASTTTLDPVPTPQTYGSVAQFRATVSPMDATGTVTFKDHGNVLGVVTLDGITGVAVWSPAPTELTVSNNPHVIVAVYSGRESIPGVQTGYAGSVSAPAPLTIAPKPVTLAGTKVFDGNPNLSLSEAANWVVGNLDGAALTVSGTARLSTRNGGAATINGPGNLTPDLVVGRTVSAAAVAVTTMTLNMPGAPSYGNTLVATIGYRNADAADSIYNITQTGVTWQRATSYYGNSMGEEIWYGTVGCTTAGTSVLITTVGVALRMSISIGEFSGVLAGSAAVDQQAGASGNNYNAATWTSGTTRSTTASPELWVAGGSLKGYGGGTYTHSTCTVGGGVPTLTTPTGGFIQMGQASTPFTGGTAPIDCDGKDRLTGYGFYRANAPQGAAVCTATMTPPTYDTVDWAGAVATFRPQSWVNSLALSGPAAPNYTLTSAAGGLVTVTGRPLTVTAKPFSKVYDGTTVASVTPIYDSSALLCGDTVTTANEIYASKDVGSGITVVPNLVINDGNGGANYSQTRINATGTINPKALTVSGSTATDKTYDGTTVDPLGGAPAFQDAEAPGSGTTADGKPYTGDTISVGGTPTGAFADPNAGLSKPVSFSGVTVTGPQALDYTVTQQANSSASIRPRVVALGGGRTYDGGTAVSAGNLTITNNVDSANLTLSGNAVLGGRNVGTQTITSPAFSTYAAPTRVRSATGNTPTNMTTSSFTVAMPAVPTNGNTLVAVIATRSTTAGRVSTITQTGVTWRKAAEGANTGGSTTEIWYGTNVQSGAAAAVTITFTASIRAAAVVSEYSGVLTASPLDRTANATGSSSTASTGTTPTTLQTSELWVGGIGLVSSGYALSVSGNPLFSTVASAQSASGTSTLNAKVYALEYVAGATGTASSGGTISTSSQWSGAMATFKAAINPGTLALGGPAANNYTLIGSSGTATIAKTNLTVTPTANTKPYDGNSTAEAVPTIPPNSIQAGDTAPSPFWTEGYSDRNAGTGRMLVIVDQTLRVSDGNGGANYNYIYQTPTTGTINQLPLTITAQPNTKMYDGTISAAAAPIMTGTIISPDVEPAWTQTYDTINVGTGKTLSVVPQFINDGNGGLNYSYNYVLDHTGVITNLVIAADQQPTNFTTCVNSPAVFSTTVSGEGLSYQWQIGTNYPIGTVFYDIAGATNASYTNPAVTYDDAGTFYQVIVSGPGTATITSAPPAELIVIMALWASANPHNQTICSGVPAVLHGILSQGATVALWSGGGTFLPDNSSLDVTYTPSAAEIAAGSATVTLTGSQPGSLCAPATSTATIAILPGPIANAGPDQTVCADAANTQLAGSYSGTANFAYWGGAGTFVRNRFALNAVYIPTAAEIAAGSATLTLTATASSGPCGPVTDTMTIYISPAATASVGPSQIICSGSDTAALGGTVGGAATGGLWTASPGGGTFTPDDTTLDAFYTPSAADISAQAVTLTLHATGQLAPCAPTANVVVTIHPAATVGTAGDQTICSSSSTAPLGGTVGGGATGGLWTSSGTGTFSPNGTTLGATYNPSAADIAAGTVTLTLTTTGQLAPCFEATTQVMVTIHLAATASAGPDHTICSGSLSAQLGGIVGGGATGGLWTSSGTGIFSPNATTLNGTYTPTEADISAGAVTLTLSSTGQIDPCTPATAQVVVAIHLAATASAGGNQTICADQITAPLGGTVGGGATGGTWTSSGTGAFSPNATTLNATYHPSAADKTAQAVKLTLSSTGQIDPCTAASTQVAVTIHALPAITGQPANLTVCAGTPAVFSVAATGTALAYEWQVSLDFGATWESVSEYGLEGTYASLTNALTHIAESDGGLYQVIVSGACSPAVTSAPPVELIVGLPATVDAGPNQTVCASSPAVALDGSFGDGATTATWSGSGAFTPNATTLNAVYTPTAGEIAAQTATVTLTASNSGGACPPVAASMTITINPAATVSAGVNQTVCTTSPATHLAGSIGGAASSARWTGAGTFVPNAFALNAVYTPTAAQIAAGTATVTLRTDDPAGPCGVVSASMTITIHQLAAITSQPPSQTISAGSPAIFTVVATGVGLTYQWQVSADGGTTFTNISDTATNASYTSGTTTMADNGHQYQVIVAGMCSSQTSTQAVLTIIPMAVRPPSLIGPTWLSNGRFQFAFSNSDPGASFTVLTTTNPWLPLSNWTVAGPATNTAPGLFQFSTDATNSPEGFYRVRSP